MLLLNKSVQFMYAWQKTLVMFQHNTYPLFDHVLLREGIAFAGCLQA